MLNPIDRENTPAGAGGTTKLSIFSDAQRLRRFVAIAACVAFGINLLLAQVTLSSARDGDVSAIQIIQVWTPHIYYAILITGVSIALYIYSRSVD